jgi:hypothetical protein
MNFRHHYTPSRRTFKRKNKLSRTRLGALLSLLVQRSKTSAVVIDVAHMARSLAISEKTIHRSLDKIRGREINWIKWYGIVVVAGFEHGYSRTPGQEGRGRRIVLAISAPALAAGRLHLADLLGRRRHLRTTWGTKRWYFAHLTAAELQAMTEAVLAVGRTLPPAKSPRSRSNGHLLAPEGTGNHNKASGRRIYRDTSSGGARIGKTGWWCAFRLADIAAERGLPALNLGATAFWVSFWLGEGLWREVIFSSIDSAAERVMSIASAQGIKNPAGLMFSEADKILRKKLEGTTLTRGQRIGRVYQAIEDRSGGRLPSGREVSPW